jgi:carbamoyltransferase
LSDPVYILGIHDGHNCGATLTRNGKVVASICEERLTRRKNEVGYPRHSIEEVLRLGGIAAGDLTEVVYASLFMHASAYLTELEKWYCVGLAEQRAAESAPKDYQKVVFETRKRERIDAVRDQLGVAIDRVSFVEHHLAHLAAAYYTAPNAPPGKPILGLTNDGAGDGICGTVSICRGNDIERLAAIDRHASLGKIYSRVTMLMGMTPWEHEYKIMGLAPYADSPRADRAAEALRRLIHLSGDGLTFERVGELSTNYCYEYLRDSFERVRFDTIAGATQVFTEEMLVSWVRACVARTGIRDIVAGGGVFMNVKANMLIAALPEVDSFYVMPSASDESLSIGAALHRYYQRSSEIDHGESVLTDLYLGGEFGARDEERAIADGLSGSGARIVRPNDMSRAIAELLADGEIVAVCRGRMEWGARALGNRSILAGADDTRRVDRINRMIKMRDFWMPFAPSIRAEAAGRYFEDPKDLKPWFMTMAFEARPEGYDDLAAGSHPRDRTIRPQVVTRDANPAYHAVLGHFEERTGRGAFLNTSFNLHGEPIVYSPADAIRVLLNSGLEHLALGHHLVSKDRAATADHSE